MWLKTENYTIFLGNQRLEGVHMTNERRTIMRNYKSNVIEGKRGTIARRNMQHLENEVDSMHV